MPRRLDPAIVRDAEDAARKPDFTAVLDRGRTLARRRLLGATAATVMVVAVAGIVGASQLPDRREAIPVVPVVPSPSPTPSATATESAERDRPTPREMVDDPRSRLVDVRSVTDDLDTRVALWRWCPSDSCRVRAQALTLTTDGFETSVVPDATWSNAVVRLSEDGAAVVVDYRATSSIDVVRPDGTVVEVDTDTEEAPVATGEVVAGSDLTGTTPVFWATDVTDARAHAVPVPDGTYQLVQTDSGQLRVLTQRRTYAWSDDGGATWNESTGGGDGALLQGFVSSLDDTHVLVGGGDGATLFPFAQIGRLDTPDSWAVVDVDTDPTAYIGPTAALPDGRILASVLAWSDNGRFGEPLEGTPPGIYVSEGDDWSTYERIASGAPFDTPSPMLPRVMDVDVTSSGARITAFGPDETTVWMSTDLGATWQQLPAR